LGKASFSKCFKQFFLKKFFQKIIRLRPGPGGLRKKMDTDLAIYIIQDSWRKFIINRRLRFIYNPESSLLARFKTSQRDAKEIIKKSFIKIQDDNTHFRILIIKFLDAALTFHELSITWYSPKKIQFVDNDNLEYFNLENFEISKIEDLYEIISVKIQAVIKSEPYGYPEFHTIKCF